MANGGSVYPSATGGGLGRATRAILEATIAKREREQRERQLDLSERGVAVSESANSLNRLVTLAGILPPGTTVGDLGESGIRMFGQAFQIPDPHNYGDIELNRETMESLIDRVGMDWLNSPEGRDTLIPSIRARLGIEPSEAVANAAEAEANMRIGILEGIGRDPELVNEWIQRTVGRDPVTLTIPGGDGRPDRTISFDSPTAATIYAGFLQNRERFGFELSVESAKQDNTFIESIQEAVRQADHEVSRSALLSKVIPLYNQAVSEGDVTQINAFLESGATEGEKLALEYLVGSIATGDERFIGQLPDDLQMFFRIGDRVARILGMDKAAEIMPSLTEGLGEGNIAQLRDPFWGGLRLSFGSEAPGAAPPPAQGGLGLENASFSDRLKAAQELLDEGMSLAELSQFVEDDVATALSERSGVDVRTIRRDEESSLPIPEGGFDPSTVPASVREDARKLNQILRGDTSLPPRQADALARRLRGRVERNLIPAEPSGVQVVPPGGFDPSTVPVGLRSKVNQLNNLLRRRDEFKGPQKRGSEAVIRRLQAEIRRGIERGI